MNEPSKEAMEKAEEIWQKVFAAYRKAPLGTTIDKVGTPLIAIEFTNYQKRIDELEKQNHNYRVRIKKFKQDWHIR
jgi:hypothetical protein